MELDLEAIRQLAEEDPDAAKEMVRKYRKAMIVLARNDPSWFCQYVLKNRDGAAAVESSHQHDSSKHTGRTRMDRCAQVRSSLCDTCGPSPWQRQGLLQLTA
jgi:hypothetical protein